MVRDKRNNRTIDWHDDNGIPSPEQKPFIDVGNRSDKKRRVLDRDKKKKEKLKKEKVPKSVNRIFLNKKKTTFQYWKDKITDKLFPSKTVLINMELLNGMHRSMLIKEKNGSFKWENKQYLLEEKSRYFNIDSKIWCYDFHESYVLPIKRVIPVSDIKKGLEETELTEVEYATNPSTLERFIVARIAEGIMAGHKIDEMIKQIRLFLIILLVLGAGHLLLFMFKTGMLQSVKLPF